MSTGSADSLLPRERSRRALLHVVNRCGDVLHLDRLRAVDFDAEHLLEQAVRRSGLDDFGEDHFREPLNVLLDALRREAQLTFIGRLAMREELVQLLITRLQIEADRRRYPAIGQAGVEAPLFITGLPRSGTTFLHGLLESDPSFRAPSAWEVMFPSPPTAIDADSVDARVARAERRVRQMDWLAPDFKVIHALDAEMPQECITMTAPTFLSDEFPTMCHVPGYQRWLYDAADLSATYRFHRRFLQQLQGGVHGLRWLLKAPAHLFALPQLLQVYPDARLVFTHRDPRQALPSLASLTLTLRAAFSDRRDPVGIGREALRLWSEGMREARAFVLEWANGHRRCIDVHYEELTGRPLETVERIYRHFDIELSAAARRRMCNYIEQRPKDRFGKHRYSLDQFGFDARDIERAFEGLQRYCA